MRDQAAAASICVCEGGRGDCRQILPRAHSHTRAHAHACTPNVTHVALATCNRYVTSASCCCGYMHDQCGQGRFLREILPRPRPRPRKHANTPHARTRDPRCKLMQRVYAYMRGRVYRTATKAMQGRSIGMCRSHPGSFIPSASTLWPATRPGAAHNTRRGTRTVTRTSRSACQVSRLRISPVLVASRRAQLVALERPAQCVTATLMARLAALACLAPQGGPTERHEAPRAPQELAS